MNVYDFDGTILDGDSEVYFFYYVIREKLIPFLPRKFFASLYEKQLTHKVDTLKSGNVLYRIIFKYVKNLDEVLERFWDEHQKYVKPFYKTIQKEDDVINSGTPTFILKPIMKRLNINHYIGSEWDYKKKCFYKDFNFGKCKVPNFVEQYDPNSVDTFYSDLEVEDLPMAKLAKKAVRVAGNEFYEWNFDGLKTSTEIDSLKRHVGFENAIKMYAKAGFDYYDFSMFEMINYDWEKQKPSLGDSPLVRRGWKKYVKHLRDVAIKCSIRCNQSHAPFPTDNYLTRKYLKRCIKITSILGGKTIIIHPGNWLDYKENAAFYKKYIKYAHKCDVKIATENMWGWDNKTDRASFASCATSEDFLKLINEVNDDFFGACVDVGHAEMMGDMTNAPKIIRDLGDKVFALHLHDNDCWKDLHQLPFTNKINFDEICKALKDIGYKGEITLEADTYLNDKKDCLEESIVTMCKTAKKLSSMVKNSN